MSIAMVALLASCSSDMELAQSGEKFDGKVTLSAPAYEYEDGTRTTLTSSESGISFAWDDDETIGIFPIAPTTNAQAHQKLDNGSNNGTKSSFDGAGWALLRGNTYAAYYPFQTEEYEDYTKIPIDMTGQTQDGNGSLAHIGAGYDYMYATASVPKNGGVSFDFNHVCSIVKLELTMPVAATWENVTLSSGSSVFITKATMNASTGAIASVTKSSSVVLSLSNVRTTSANQKLELYMAVLPTTTGDLTIKARTTENYDYVATFSSINLKAGKSYLRSATLSMPIVGDGDGRENGYAWIDFGLKSGLKWATMNIGATSPVEGGNKYAWGETEPQESYVRGNWETYKWCNGTQNTLTKYNSNSSYGTVDYKWTLEADDDAANVAWGGKWCMPTRYNITELINNTYMVYTENYCESGVAGYIVYKVKSDLDKGVTVNYKGTPLDDYSLNDTHIFIPALSKTIYYGQVDEWGMYSDYWTSSRHDMYPMQGYVIRVSYYNGISTQESNSRYTEADRLIGHYVRAVCK